METIDTTNSETHVEYAGFWLRFVAYIIDGCILGAVYFIVMVPILALMGISAFTHRADINSMSDDEKAGMIISFMGAFGAVILALAILGWLYYAFMESSSKQATVGKMALGLKVTDMNGGRISFLNATGRYFGKIVSHLILYIGFIMAGLTEKKQGLHDIMAGCLVVKSN